MKGPACLTAGALEKLVQAAHDVTNSACLLHECQLVAFGPGVPEAVEVLRGAPPDAVETAAWQLAGVVRAWIPDGIDAGGYDALMFTEALVRLGSAVKTLDVARQMEAGR